MKKLFLLLLIVPSLCKSQINYKVYNNGQSVFMAQYKQIADSVGKSNSGWHVATLEDLQAIQKTLTRKDWKISGNYWVNSLVPADYPGIKYCFISDSQFKMFMPQPDIENDRVMLVEGESKNR